MKWLHKVFFFIVSLLGLTLIIDYSIGLDLGAEFSIAFLISGIMTWMLFLEPRKKDVEKSDGN